MKEETNMLDKALIQNSPKLDKMEKPVISSKDLTKSDQSLLNPDQLNMLLSETPKHHRYKRPAKGGGEWDYVTGVYVKKVLNMVFGWNWSFQVKQFEYTMEAKQCIVLGTLTIKSKGETIIKEQFGRSDIAFKTKPVLDSNGKPIMIKGKGGKEYPKKEPSDQPLDLGNDLKAATTDALKKCASELGIASDIYGADEFKNIRVADESDEDIIKDMQKTISEQISMCQDPELTALVKEKLLEAEAHGTNTVEFYSEIIKMFG